MSFTIKNKAQFLADLQALGTPGRLCEYAVAAGGRGIMQATLAQARSGAGPANSRYPVYSEEYGKRKRKAVGIVGNWLKGIEHTGREQGALAEQNFQVRAQTTGPIRGILHVWTAPDPQAAIYMEVHQEGLPIGRGGPRKQRKWMHFDAPAIERAAERAIELGLERMIGDYMAGTLKPAGLVPSVSQ